MLFRSVCKRPTGEKLKLRRIQMRTVERSKKDSIASARRSEPLNQFVVGCDFFLSSSELVEPQAFVEERFRDMFAQHRFGGSSEPTDQIVINRDRFRAPA